MLLAGLVGWLAQQLSLLALQPFIAGIKKVGRRLGVWVPTAGLSGWLLVAGV